MKFISFIILGLGIFDVALSEGFFGFFEYDLFGDAPDKSQSSDYGICSFLSELFGSDYDEDNKSDEASNETTDQVQLPGGPSWLETMHPAGPQPPSYHPPQPGHEQEGQHQQSQPQPPPESNYEPSPTPNPFYPTPQQQQQVQPIFNSSQPIPTSLPVAGIPLTLPGGTSEDTVTPEDTLILSIPDDEADNTDGEGVLVGE